MGAVDDVLIPGAVGRFDRRTLYPHERAALELGFSRIGGATGARVLDMGCGRGRTTAVLVDDYRAEVEAFDIDPAIIEEAKRDRPDIPFDVADATRLDGRADASCDLVLFSFNGLDYIPDAEGRRRCLSEVARVLRPGGAFVYSSHNRRALLANKDARRILRHNLWRILTGTEHLIERSRHWAVACWHGTPDREAELLAAAGLSLLAVHSRRAGTVSTDVAAASAEHWPYYVAVRG